MPVPGSDQDWVLDHLEALHRAVDDTAPLGSRVVILDVVGHVQGIGLAELLASQGRDTTAVCPLPVLLACDGETQAAILPRAVQAGVTWRPSTALAAIGDHTVTLVDVLSRRLETIADVDTVAICTNGVANDELFHALEGQVPEVVRVGDAVAMRPVDRAVYDGHRAARAL
jgi:hypothetical protein